MNPKQEKGIRDAGDLIRKAWRAGQKEVEIDGVKLTIVRQDHKIAVQENGKKHQIESWLVASPKEHHKFVPCYSVELEPGKNSRVRFKGPKAS